MRVQTRKNGETRFLTEAKIQNQKNKNEDHEQERKNPFDSGILKWLQDFRDNFMDVRVTAYKYSHVSSSREPFLRAAEASGTRQSQCLFSLPN